MKAYILPEFKEKFEKLVNRASKHLEHKPAITFSEPMTKTKHTYINWKCDGEHGQDKYKNIVTVIEVTIDDITSGDWVLVANVFFKEQIIGMVSGKYYKDIPSNLGLDYSKCDYCGYTHPNRTKSHIVFNTRTGEWKQIGTACGKKMFEAGDLCQFTVKLIEVFNQTFACAGEDDWKDWCGRIPDHSWQEAYSVDSIIPAVVGYRKEINPEWEKACYNKETRIKEPGTTKFLQDYYFEHQQEHDELLANGETKHYNALVIDEAYNAKVREFVSQLPDEYEEDYYTGAPDTTRPKMKTKIKIAFENKYILIQDIYTVFFAVKMYEDSLTRDDWEKLVESIKIGEKNEFRGVSLVSKDFYEDIYGCGYFCKFITREGLTIGKSFNNYSSFESQFMNNDGTFSFACRADFINNRNRFIRLGGRVSRIK